MTDSITNVRQQREGGALQVGALIARARRYAGVTQSELAAAVGCAQSHISNWEAGKREPGVGDLLAIADALAVPLEALLPTKASTDVRQAFEDGLRRGYRDCERAIREALDRGRP